MTCNPSSERVGIHIGLTRHKDKTYPGQHEAIVEQELWDGVQQQLKGTQPASGVRVTQAEPSPLLRKLFDDAGERLVPHHANKKGVRYRYYVSAALITAEDRPDGSGWRLPAAELERTVRRLINLTLQDQTSIVRACQDAGLDTRVFSERRESAFGRLGFPYLGI